MRAATTAVLLAIVVLIAACDPGVDQTTDPPDVVDPPADEPEPDGDPVDGDPAEELPADDETDDEQDEGDQGEPPTEETATGPISGIQLTLEPVTTADAPIDAALAPAGDVVWLAERPGTVRPLAADGSLGDAVIDISAETTTDAERGLLGIAVHPDGEHVYASFTDADGHTQVDEWTVDGDGVDADSRRTVFTAEQPFGNHNGGGILFGPDNNLWLGLGDGGGGGDPVEAGQDWTTVLGTMVRIDPREGDPYAVPSDNPFADNPDEGAPEAWARGLRNPWRFSFDPVDGTLWIADVGQNEIEEINAVDPTADAGANFGWNEMEGDQPFEGGTEPDDHTPPIHTYPIAGQDRCSITGGVVYRGEAVPELAGVYLYSDFCDGVIRGLRMDDGEVAEADVDLGAIGSQIVGFSYDVDGEVLVMDLAGEVQRLVPDG